MPAKELRTRLFIGIADDRSDKVYRLERLTVEPPVTVGWELSYTCPVEGDVVYQVHQRQDGSVSCCCKGFRMHEQRCRHIRGLLQVRLLRPIQGEE